MTEFEVLPRYEAYRDSGIEWLGRIPSDWKVIPLRYLAKVQTGNTPSKNIDSYYSKYEGLPWIKPDELNEFKKLFSSKEKLTKKGVKEARIIPKNSVLVCCIGTIGKIGVAGCHLSTNQQINSITFMGNVNPSFAKYLIFSSSIEHEKLANGNVVKILNTNTQKSIHLVIPSKIEQTAIANFLDKKTTQIDEAIAIKQKQIELLKERKQIIIQKAVTQGLDPNVPMRNSGVDWIGEIPEHWKVRRSKFLFTQRKERAWKNDVQLSATQAYGVIPQHEYEARTGKTVVKIQFHLDKRKHVEQDDFVISMRSFQGGLERAWSSGCIRSSYIILKPLEKIEPAFYGHLLKLPSYIKALQRTASFIRDGQDLNFENFSKIDLFIPPLEEQYSISKHIKQFMISSENGIELLQQQIKKLKEYKTTLINSAVTGKIKIPIPVNQEG